MGVLIRRNAGVTSNKYPYMIHTPGHCYLDNNYPLLHYLSDNDPRHINITIWMS